MSHGTAIKEAHAERAGKPAVGDYVNYFDMNKPCNVGPGPGPHRAKVTELCSDGSLHLKVKWPHNVKLTNERFVVHRAWADTGRFWDKI